MNTGKQLSPDPLSGLRAGTHDLHTRLDRHSMMSRLLAPDLVLGEYAHILLRLLICQLEFEPALEKLRLNISTVPNWLDPTIYHRSADLKADLDSLGYRSSWQEVVDRSQDSRLAIKIGSLAQAAGFMYVLAGSSLGARIIVRRLREQLGPKVEHALAYFSPVAGEAGWHWPAYRDALNSALVGPEMEAQALGAARALFDCFLRHMAVKPPADPSIDDLVRADQQ